jgi:DUF1680 family protein
VAVETDDTELLAALRRQWDATIARRTYLTGGMGSRHQDEAFGEDFVLPADRAYSETCAGVGSIMFSWRLLLASGDARYADLIERTLYNLVATSPSRDGKRFFYANTLHLRELGAEPAADHAVGRPESGLRAPWFGVACCPTNLARTFASLDAYVASADATGVQLHQFVPATIRTTLPDGREVALAVDTDYPRDGRIAVRIGGPSVGPWTLAVRIPHWAAGAVAITLNGTAVAAEPGGYVRLTEDFQAEDVVEVTLPMEPRFTVADPRVDAVRGCVAVERGPEVLCLESVDTPDNGHVDLVRVDPSVPPVEDGGAVLVQARTLSSPDGEPGWPYVRPEAGADSLRLGDPQPVALRPYNSWGNRGPTTMRVWLPTS